MCLHGKRAIARAVERFETSSDYGVIWIDDKEGTPLYGWDCVEIGDPQEVATWIRNLKAWHPTAIHMGGSINLSDINLKRVRQGVVPLMVEDLSEPAGSAPPSFDSQENELHMEAG